MKRRPIRLLTVVAVALMLLLAGGATSPASAAPSTAPAATAAAVAPFCGITWGSLAKSAGTQSFAPLTNVRVGRHDCFDRVVFDVAGRANGYTVQYVTQVTDPGSGAILPVTGGAKLQVTLFLPAHDENHNPTVPYRWGDRVANVAGFSTLRSVVFGGTFEAVTTFGVGVRARLPFRVFVLAGPGSNSRIVLDTAHRWQQ